MDQIIWRRPQDEPADRQPCNIVQCDGLCNYIVCNISYFRESKAWVDLFATGEAGEAYEAKNVTAWMPADLIPQIPDELVKEHRARQEDGVPCQAWAEIAEPRWKLWRRWIKKVLHR